jgi:DNA-binding transcriptional ArsR family regulator
MRRNIAMSGRYQRISDLLQVLSHPVRLQILDELRLGEACVCHLQAIVRRPQPYVSQQLGRLREADVVTDRREGIFVYYSLSDVRVGRVLEAMLGAPEEHGPVEGCSCPRCETTPSAESDVERSGVSSLVGETA